MNEFKKKYFKNCGDKINAETDKIPPYEFDDKNGRLMMGDDELVEGVVSVLKTLIQEIDED